MSDSQPKDKKESKGKRNVSRSYAKQSKQELDRLSNEIVGKLKNTNSGAQKVTGKFISFRFNPLVFLLTSILLIFLLIALSNREYFQNKVGLDQLIRGIKDNSYSQVLIQNDGKIVAHSKNYVINTSGNDLDSAINFRQYETTTVDTLVASLVQKDIISEIKALANRESSVIEKLVIGDNFVIASRSGNFKDLLVEDISEREFMQKLEDKSIMRANLALPIIRLRSASSIATSSSFNDKFRSGQLGDIWQINGTVLAEVQPEFVTSVFVDWTPSIYSFTDILQQEGISLGQDSIEIISVNVPSGINLDDILTILTLVGFVVLGYIIFRGAQSSGMGIMQFGQSKAKIFFGTKPDTTFKDVAGIDEAREELNEIVDFLKNPNKYRKLGARIPKGVLMVGPPGTGKTLLARAIAGEAGVPFFHTSGSEFEEMLVGAGASRVRDLFAKAKKASPALIFIDEIDAVARKRGTRVQSGTTEQTLNQILVEMDGFEKNTNLIVLAATNRPDVLDPAILRPGRFDRQVRIDLPDMDGRKQILGIHGKNKPFAAEVDLEKIAKRTVGFTGADLENILNESAIIAAKEGKKEIAMDDIEEAVSKVVLGPAKKSRKRTENELKLVAFHEAGHAVVSKYTPSATPVDKISIVSRGTSGGVTMFLPEKDEYIISKGKLIAEITVGLGGRAAEEIALDDISTGASNDIEKATAMARRMVQRFGMSKKLGLVQYGDFEESEYLGYAYSTSKEFSDKTAEIIDQEVKEIIDVAYQNALRILTDHRDKLDLVANTLLEREVMSKEEFDVLF